MKDINTHPKGCNCEMDNTVIPLPRGSEAAPTGGLHCCLEVMGEAAHTWSTDQGRSADLFEATTKHTSQQSHILLLGKIVLLNKQWVT